ncbi:MAG: hypothetical protein LBL65_01995 [Campylobacteraceae bacterium]|nr:hypothetical protein [Campylobacteraceae bacterium]
MKVDVRQEKVGAVSDEYFFHCRKQSTAYYLSYVIENAAKTLYFSL